MATTLEFIHSEVRGTLLEERARSDNESGEAESLLELGGARGAMEEPLSTYFQRLRRAVWPSCSDIPLRGRSAKCWYLCGPLRPGMCHPVWYVCIQQGVVLLFVYDMSQWYVAIIE